MTSSALDVLRAVEDYLACSNYATDAGALLEDVRAVIQRETQPMTTRLDALRGLLSPARSTGNKYHARATVVDGHRFDSQKEARRYGDLRMLLIARVIRDLTVHPELPLYAAGPPGADGQTSSVEIGKMTLDFKYYDLAEEAWVWEDVKGGRATRTEAYQLRKRVCEANHGITIREL